MKKPEWRIREAVPDDVTSLIALTHRVYGDSYCDERALNSRSLLDDITSNNIKLLVGEVNNTIIAQGGVIPRDHGVQEISRLMLDRRWLLQKRLVCRGIVDAMTSRLNSTQDLNHKTSLLLSSTVALQDSIQIICIREGYTPLGITFSAYPKWTVQDSEAMNGSVPLVWFGRNVTSGGRTRNLSLSGAWRRIANLSLEGLSLPVVYSQIDINPRIADSLRCSLDYNPQLQRVTCTPGCGDITLSQAISRAKSYFPASILVHISAEKAWTASICRYLESINFIPTAYLPRFGRNGDDILQTQMRPEIPSNSMRMRLVPQAYRYLEAMVATPEYYAIQSTRHRRVPRLAGIP